MLHLLNDCELDETHRLACIVEAQKQDLCILVDWKDRESIVSIQSLYSHEAGIVDDVLVRQPWL